MLLASTNIETKIKFENKFGIFGFRGNIRLMIADYTSIVSNEFFKSYDYYHMIIYFFYLYVLLLPLKYGGCMGGTEQ